MTPMAIADLLATVDLIQMCATHRLDKTGLSISNSEACAVLSDAQETLLKVAQRLKGLPMVEDPVTTMRMSLEVVKGRKDCELIGGQK